MKKTIHLAKITTLTATLLVSGCITDPNNAGMFGNNSAGAYSGLGGSLGSSVLASIIQAMASSVLNGQIGSQLAPVDQNFRLQQLGSAINSGAITQPQQWVNPQTGSQISLNPIGLATVNQNKRKNCHNLEEVVTLQNGNTVREKRVACMDPQTRKWTLVQ